MAFLGVVLSRHKFTPRCPVGETKEEKEEITDPETGNKIKKVNTFFKVRI